MTVYEMARILDGFDYSSEILSDRLKQEAKDDGIVVVFGCSDDLMELRGAIDDEVGCFDGGTVYITKKGVLAEPDCGCDSCPYYEAVQKNAVSIEAVWHNFGEPCWSYETEIPHETFRIYEGEELFCVGIVFRLEDLPM